MSADKWEYVAVTRCRAKKFDNVSPVYDIEARYRSADGKATSPRVLITAGWDFDLPDSLHVLQIVIDGGDRDPSEGHTILPIDAALMRTIPYARLLKQASVDLIERNVDMKEAQELPDFVQLRKEWPKGDTREVARWAGYIYMKAVADGEASTKAVAETFGVSRSTAKRMIAQAREQEFIAAHVVGAPGSR